MEGVITTLRFPFAYFDFLLYFLLPRVAEAGRSRWTRRNRVPELEKRISLNTGSGDGRKFVVEKKI